MKIKNKRIKKKGRKFIRKKKEIYNRAQYTKRLYEIRKRNKGSSKKETDSNIKYVAHGRFQPVLYQKRMHTPHFPVLLLPVSSPCTKTTVEIRSVVYPFP